MLILIKKQIDDYLDEIKKSLNINYLELGEYNFRDREYDEYDENYDNKSKVATVRNKAIEFKLKKNEKPIRLFAVKEMKNFLAKPDGKITFSLVTKTPVSKKRKK